LRAARFYGPGDIRIDDVPEPATRAGTVKVEVEWCGICGTDLHEYLEGPIFAPTAEAPHPLTGESVPITLGHEFAGVVAEVGEGVSRVGVGDKVVVEPYIICGRCDACRTGRYNVCQTLGFVGLSGYGGGFSQYVVAEERWIHPLGELGTDVGALIEPLAVAYHAVKLSKAQTEHTALVFGAGPIGLVTTAALKAAGVEQVLVVEPADVRKQKAPGAGADHVIDRPAPT
jgi:(R,R)-butanediol dehydrogenase/meso-butanediol dehydrogenase/diacetyl reductase